MAVLFVCAYVYSDPGEEYPVYEIPPPNDCTVGEHCPNRLHTPFSISIFFLSLSLTRVTLSPPSPLPHVYCYCV